jgi:hypothetical protein
MSFLGKISNALFQDDAEGLLSEPQPSPAETLDRIAEEIFIVENEQIIPLICPLLPTEITADSDYSLIVSLIKRVLDSGVQLDRISDIINSISKLIWFPQIVCFMLTSDREGFIRTLYMLPLQNRDHSFALALELEVTENYENIIACLRKLTAIDWTDTVPSYEYFEALLDIFNQEQFDELAVTIVSNIPPKELGSLLILIDEKQTATGCVEHLVRHYIEKDNSVNLLNELIESIVAAADAEVKKFRPLILRELLDYGERKKISQQILRNSNRLSPRALVYVLWCLPEQVLASYVKRFKVVRHCEKLISWMDQLIDLEKKVKYRTAMVSVFINGLSEDDLITLLSHMLINGSRSIPYLCPAMQMEPFQIFTLVFEPAARTNLLRQALTLNLRWNRKLVSSLCLVESMQCKREYLCNVAVMDIVSQKLMQADQGIGQFATLRDISSYIESGLRTKDLEDKMTKLEEDYVRIPCLLMALAMTDDTLRPYFIATMRYMTEEQLIAFAQQVPEGREIEVLDQLLAIARKEQMAKILEVIPYEALLLFLKAKSPLMKQKFVPICAAQKNLRQELAFLAQHEAALQPGFAIRHAQIRTQCSLQSGYILEMLSPSNLEICKFSQEVFDHQEVDDPEFLMQMINIVRRCEKYRNELSGPGGLFKLLGALDPEKAGKAESKPCSAFKIDQIPLLFRQTNNIHIKNLVAAGLVYNEDFELLGIPLASKPVLLVNDLNLLKNYLEQSLLTEIWTFLKGKKLGSITDLFKLDLVEDRKELMKMLELVKKMGFVPTGKNEQK